MKPQVPDFLEQPKNIKILLRVFYGLCASLLIINLFVHGHTQHALEKLPAFYGIFGFLVCVALSMIAKLLHKLLNRKHDYYDVQ